MPTRIVFMGTPEFAVASLAAIVEAGYPVVGVVTAPDKPAGRGMKLTESAVKKYAREKGLYILQPEKLRDPSFLESLRALRADLQVVVAFRMLPEMVWNMPPMGTVNLHGSLLPQYRGAAPINWAVINGEKETGVTTFQLQHDIDTGSILLQDRFPIGETDTAGDVHDRMMVIGARLLVRTIEGLAAGTLHSQPQENPPGLKHAPKLFTETGKIDWNKPTEDIYNLIRGLSPFPTAYTELDGKTLKIYRAEKVIHTLAPDAAPGVYDTDGKSYLRFATKDGYIRVTELQLEGKKRMPVADFLRGYRFNNLPEH
ncbi:MAG TPA: methionyl-tRNA formyltransferase [Puia sp.]|uniref:methionyl-tRNA formyltransferase n=1 Tax=Puia sp. TaxID=2045100 RepID=UPI002C11FE8D|nr:methionyl-tRNA formyltransferase [Puia sp.]HVU93920.1 methionyl-tRNA formyltransferase [Puia sp.]